MSIIRVAERPRYTRISNHVFSDSQLSFKAVGVLCQLLSYPDNWKVNAKHLATTHTDGQTAVRSALKELKERGYLRKYPVRDALGRISYWESVIFESPLDEETQNVENPHCGESSCGKPERLINTYSNQDLIEQELSVCSDRTEQPTHTGNSDLNFEDDRSGTLEQHPSETLDSGTLEQESLEIQTPVKKSKTEIEYLDLNNNPGLRISSAGARENLTSPAENAPKTRGNDLKVSNPIQPHSVPLSEFIQVYNKHRGNWRSIGVAPAPVVVAGIFGYRQSFTGTDEEFLAKFPLLLKAAQSSGGNWFKSKRNPSEIFHPDRLPLNDFWEDVQPAPLPAPEPQPQPSPAPTQGTIKPTFFFGEI